LFKRILPDSKLNGNFDYGIIQGVYIKVIAEAGAKREQVTRVSAERYTIQVREPAERNMANTRIRTLLARELGVAEGLVRLVAGHRSPHKIFSVN
jgi:uncharacterized protein YggU (UPF0235/DUF167 family)